MATSTKNQATVTQAQAYLKDLGYNNPDSGEVQGALADLNSNPDTLAKYATVTTGESNSIDPTDLWSSASKTGITQDIFGKLNPTQQATIAALGDSVGTLYSSGSTGVTLSDALKTAANDPTLTAKYADALNLDTSDFSQGLLNLQQSVSTEAETQRMQFERDRKALAEANAANGTAYSGFRQQAQTDLATTEAGIVTSSRSRNQANLDNLKKNFAAKYGSAATPSATIQAPNPLFTAGVGIAGTTNPDSTTDNTLTGNTPNLTGSVGATKQSDILSKATSLYGDSQLPNL